MDHKLQMEQFSRAWLHAVATLSGLSTFHSTVDDDSVDVLLGRTGGNGTAASPRLEVQLKCTERNLLHDDGVHIQLKPKNFEDLRHPGRMIPMVLVVLLVPPTVSDWWRPDPETSLTLHRAAWWMSLRGLSPQAESPTVVLPRRQLFDPPALTAIMDRVGRKEDP